MDSFVGKPLTPEKLRKVLVEVGQRLITNAPVHALPPPPPADDSMNLSLLKFLSDGSAAGLQAQIERYLTAVDEIATEVATLVDQRTIPPLASAIHRLLGQARMVEHAAFTQAVLEMQSALRAEDWPACTRAFQGVRHEIAAVRAALHRHRPVEHSA
jgi:hypothetical protein